MSTVPLLEKPECRLRKNGGNKKSKIVIKKMKAKKNSSLIIFIAGLILYVSKAEKVSRRSEISIMQTRD